MGQITEELLRKRSEHNEGQLSTLQEVALHQFEIEKIELLGQKCKHLVILYLQNNLISKIENLNKLKDLQYLNLALNNIEVLENLQGCESLVKLDLTVNFIRKLSGVKHMEGLYHLAELYLTGNPCTKFEHYREYVIAVLPQLQRLDGSEVTKSERILALQKLPDIAKELEAWEQKAEEERAKEKAAAGDKKDAESFGHTPEERVRLHEELVARREASNPTPKPEPKPEYVPPKPGERVLNKNEGKWHFEMQEDDAMIIVNVTIGKYVDTSLIEADIHPTWIRATAKDKTLQLVLPDEVSPDASLIQRSTLTGILAFKCKKVNPIIRPANTDSDGVELKAKGKGKGKSEGKPKSVEEAGAVSIHDIYKEADELSSKLQAAELSRTEFREAEPSAGFVDDPDVPPLE